MSMMRPEKGRGVGCAGQGGLLMMDQEFLLDTGEESIMGGEGQRKEVGSRAGLPQPQTV